MVDDVSVLPGARLLWIDDHPNEVLGERRILRSLGVEVVAVASTSEAVAALSHDADFDLIVTDVQREGGLGSEIAGGIRVHEGVNFIVALREGKVQDLASISSLKDTDVLFYAAYDRARLLEFTRRAREIEPKADAANDVATFVVKAVRLLAESRRNPIEPPPKKNAT